MFGNQQQSMFGGMGGAQGGVLGAGGNSQSLLGGQPNTQQMMQQYLQSLFMRQYNPPAIAQQPGMVGSQMGLGGMQYMAPQSSQSMAPQQTEMERLQEQLRRLQQSTNAIDPRVQRNNFLISGGEGG